MFLIWWSAGLVISLLIGGLATPKLLDCLRGKIKERAQEIDKICEDDYKKFFGLEYFSPWITGTIERLFFTILVGFNVSGTATAMIGWISVKMGVDWLLVLKGEGKAQAWQRQLAFSALLGSVISLIFALIGGLIFSKGVN